MRALSSASIIYLSQRRPGRDELRSSEQTGKDSLGSRITQKLRAVSDNPDSSRRQPDDSRCRIDGNIEAVEEIPS